MTITKDDLRKSTLRHKLSRISYHMEFLCTCLNALPEFPANEHLIESYLAEMEKACAEMKETLDA